MFQRPTLLAQFGSPADRAILYGIGLSIVLADATGRGDFTAQFSATLQARIADAEPDKAVRLRRIALAIGTHLGLVSEFGVALRRRGRLIEDLQAARAAIDEALGAFDGGAA